MSKLHLLLYASRISSAVEDVLELTIKDILRISAKRNAACAVTGILIAYRGWFIQALEGPKAAVSQRFNAISRDPRHQDLLLLGQGPTLARVFGNWSMCSSVLSQKDQSVLEILGRKPSFDPSAYPVAKVFQLLTTVAEGQRIAVDVVG